MFPAVEQEGIVYFRTWHDFAMMVSKVRFFEGKESLLGCETPIYKISTTFFDQDKINALKMIFMGLISYMRYQLPKMIWRSRM